MLHLVHLAFQPGSRGRCNPNPVSAEFNAKDLDELAMRKKEGVENCILWLLHRNA